MLNLKTHSCFHDLFLNIYLLEKNPNKTEHWHIFKNVTAFSSFGLNTEVDDLTNDPTSNKMKKLKTTLSEKFQNR